MLGMKPGCSCLCSQFVFLNIGLYCLVDGVAWLENLFFDVSLIGHSECVSFVKRFNLTLLVSLYQFMFALHSHVLWMILQEWTSVTGHWRWGIHKRKCCSMVDCWNRTSSRCRAWIMACYTKILFSFINGIGYLLLLCNNKYIDQLLISLWQWPSLLICHSSDVFDYAWSNSDVSL